MLVLYLSLLACGPASRRDQLIEVPDAEVGHLEESVRNHYREAASSYRAVLDDLSIDDRELATAAGELGEIAQVYKLWRTSEAAYQNAVALQPESFRWNYLLANMLAYRGQPDEALAHFRRALAEEPGSLPTRIYLLETLLDLGDLAAADQLAADMLATELGSAPVRFLVGQLKLVQGHWAEAIEHLEACLELDANATSAHHGLASAYGAVGNEQQARLHREHAGTGRPRIEDPVLGTLSEISRNTIPYERSAQDAIRAGYNSAAVSLLERAQEVAPTQPRVSYSLAVSLSRAGRLDEAMVAFDRILAQELSPAARSIALVNRGLVHARKGSAKLAEADYREALELDPEVPNGDFNLATLLCQTGRPGEGLLHMRTAREVDPSNANIVVHLAACIEEFGEHRKALSALRAAVEDPAMPTGNRGVLVLAELRLRLREPSVSATETQEVLDSATVWFKRTARVEFLEVAAHAQALLGRGAQAIGNLQAASTAVVAAGRPDLAERFAEAILSLENGERPAQVPILDGSIRY